MAAYRDDILEILEDQFRDLPQVRPGLIFGHPGFKVGDRVFCFAWEDGLCLKLPKADYEAALDMEEAEPFMPGIAERLRRQLGVEDMPRDFDQALAWGGLPENTAIGKTEPLFPRVDIKAYLKESQMEEPQDEVRDLLRRSRRHARLTREPPSPGATRSAPRRRGPAARRDHFTV